MKVFTSIVVAVSVVAASAEAQVGKGSAAIDSTVPGIMKRAGRQASAIWLRDILRQVDSRHRDSKLDELADSLAGRAIKSLDPPTAESKTAAISALNTLILAGSNSPLRGTPYMGAYTRVVRVLEEAPSRDIRARALGGLLAVGSHTNALSRLKQVAESNDPLAYDAINFLITDASGGSWLGISPSATHQQESVVALRTLAARSRVSDPKAARLLTAWVARNGG
jgi:hypothetical protein